MKQDVYIQVFVCAVLRPHVRLQKIDPNTTKTTGEILKTFLNAFSVLKNKNF